MTRIIFAGTPEFAVPSLQALLRSMHEVVAVYTQPDRPAGRGQKLRFSPVKQIAVAADIPVFQPIHLKTVEAQQELAALQPDLMIVIAYGLLLPEAVLTIPRLGCINVHASLLPRWRGAAPIHRAIEAGDPSTGVGIMQMDAGLDTGAIWLESETPILPNQTCGELHDQLAQLGAESLLQALPRIITQQSTPTPQHTDDVIYAHKISKDEALVNWQEPASTIARKVMAFNPFPVMRSGLSNGKSLRLLRADALNQETTAAPGTILAIQAEGMDIACQQGILRVTQLQWPDRKAQHAAEFYHGLQTPHLQQLIGSRLA